MKLNRQYRLAYQLVVVGASYDQGIYWTSLLIPPKP
uniref:Uncharacterized protein n=1 Tax=Arundo donax TaxID=35708 RepID=A0A0A9G0L1_ARUDO